MKTKEFEKLKIGDLIYWKCYGVEVIDIDHVFKKITAVAIGKKSFRYCHLKSKEPTKFFAVIVKNFSQYEII